MNTYVDITVMVTIRQLKDISKNELKKPRFDFTSSVNYVIDYISKSKGCKPDKVEVLVKYD